MLLRLLHPAGPPHGLYGSVPARYRSGALLLGTPFPLGPPRAYYTRPYSYEPRTVYGTGLLQTGTVLVQVRNEKEVLYCTVLAGTVQYTVLRYCTVRIDALSEIEDYIISRCSYSDSYCDSYGTATAPDNPLGSVRSRRILPKRCTLYPPLCQPVSLLRLGLCRC